MTKIASSNLLLARMSAGDQAAIVAASVPTTFVLGDRFCEPGDVVSHVHFINSGVISAIAAMEDGRTVETFMIGREGATNVWAADVPVRGHSRLVAQSEGETLKIEVARLKALMDTSAEMRRIINAYSVGLLSQLEQSVACNALHHSEQRFAKWLLRCHDRMDGDVLHLTQEYLASMLGSQRTTVNEAAQTLQRAGAIAYSRGRVHITDRAALEKAACECYGDTAGLQAVADPAEAQRA